jgi:hypothetical protein
MPRPMALREALDREKLSKLYLTEGLSTVVIGRRFGVSATAVLKLLNEYGIPRRTRGGGKT